MNASGERNVLIVQSGGCTPVMNRSLVALVRELFDDRPVGEVYGAIRGFDGILNDAFLDLRRQPRSAWRRIANTPGAALGSGRRNLRAEDMPRVLDILGKHKVGYLFAIGGNDSAESAHRITMGAKVAGHPVVVIHAPKTIDNDLLATDHSPGYGSAARFVALATMGAGRDAEAMGKASPITVLEVMGRDAGWLAASAALGKKDEMDAPHFICLPEVPIDEGLPLTRIEDAYKRWGFAVAVTAENARGRCGPLGGQQSPFYTDDFGHEYFEGPGRYLAQLVGKELNVRVRFEKPGTIQRSSMACLSQTDGREASLVGQAAVRYALDGYSDSMVTLVRQPDAEYECKTGLAPLEEIAGKVKVLPAEFIDRSAGLVAQAYLRYARPLIGDPLPEYGRLVGSARYPQERARYCA